MFVRLGAMLATYIRTYPIAARELKSAKELGARRYARVPVGDSKTCEFCVSVAANGFHGLTEVGAKKLTELHDNCRCKIVPQFGKAASVEGYDPAEYKEAYDKMAALEARGYSHEQIHKAMAGVPVKELGAPNSGKGGRPAVSAMEKMDALLDRQIAAGDYSKEPSIRNAQMMRRSLRKHQELWDGDCKDAAAMFADDLPAGLRSIAAEGLTYLPKQYVEKLMKSGVTFNLAKDKTMAPQYRCYARGLNVYLVDKHTDELHVVHECVHVLDRIDQEFLKADQEFYRKRTKGTRAACLADLYPQAQYGDREYTYVVPGAYNLYTYKQYLYPYSYETSTMAIEYLYRDPHGLRNKEPELFDFAVKQLFRAK